MPEFHYRALTQVGEIVSGTISAPTYEEVRRRLEYLGLISIEDEKLARPEKRFSLSLETRSSAEEVTILTGDLALLLKTGARINDALELLATDVDIGRLRQTVGKINAAVLSGDTFADALSQHPRLFSPMYLALVRVGEVSGSLDTVLEKLAAERVRAETLRRKIIDAIRYPAFILLAASGVLTFFLTFVLPQFETVLRDFNARADPILYVFFGLSRMLRANIDLLAMGVVVAIVGGWYFKRKTNLTGLMFGWLGRLPGLSRVLDNHRTALFCRNLSILLQCGVGLAPSLRILAEIMATVGKADAWTQTMDHVRHGGKLSEGLSAAKALPPMAIRMLRLGEETGRLPLLSSRIADFYEAKLQRSLDRITGIVGPAAIIIISIVVGGLIVSVMTALISINQVVG